SLRADNVVKLNYIPGPHPDASETGRLSNVPFLRCAVNVNVAAVGIRVLRFASPQPENAGHDWIAAGSIRDQDLASATPVLEDGSQRSAVANLFRNFKFAERRPITAR